MPFFIIDESERDNSRTMELLDDFYPFAKQRMKFDKDATIRFVSDRENAKKELGRTAYYDPDNHRVTVYVDNRHPKDILRSVSHELVHHAQNCRGEFDENSITFEGYAQENPHLRKMEMEAYLMGSGMHFRDWEDSYKLGEKIMKEWKQDKKEKKVLKEAKKEKGIKHDCASHVKENTTGREGVVISHSLLEDGTVNFYTVDFGDEVVEDINVSELTVLEMREHMHQKRDEPKPDYLDLDKDGDKEESMSKAAKDKKVKKEGKSIAERKKEARENTFIKLMEKWTR
tara:strand:+ start:8158 stop:9015 length:858 start_codon:yes stop_codon:yes gene_type:complete